MRWNLWDSMGVEGIQPMRLIERQMNAAISNCKSWKCANTEVSTENDGVSVVYLHGHRIAEIGDDFVQLFDGGHQTATTKSRLNAILSAHGAGERIFSKNFEWFVIVNGEKVPFTNGMELR